MKQHLSQGNLHCVNCDDQILLAPMIDDLLRGLASQQKIIRIPSEYCYFPKEQAEETQKMLALMGSKEDQPITAKLIKSFLNKKGFRPQNPTTLIELGVGPILNPVQLHQELINDFNITKLIAIDASQNILNLLSVSDEFAKIRIEKICLCLNFLDITRQPELLLRLVQTQQKIYFFLGSTFVNFEKSETLKFLASFLKSGDVVVIGCTAVLNYSDKEIDTMLQLYSSQPKLLKEIKDYDCQNLYVLGFESEDFDYQFVFDKNTNSLEGIATVLNIPKSINPVFLTAGLRVGQKFSMILSRKFTANDFKLELNSIGLEAEVHHLATRYVLAVCQKI